MNKKTIAVLAAVLIGVLWGTAFGGEWSLTVGGSATDYARSGQRTADGGYVATGHTVSSGAGSLDIWVINLTSDGSVSWQKTYGGTGDDDAYFIRQTTDGGYIVAGYTNSFGAGGADVWVLKLASDGSVTWQKTYGGTGDETASSIRETDGGGYIVAGQTTSSGAGGYDAWVFKLDPDGTVAWQRTYGGTAYDTAADILQTSDGGYIVAGQTASWGAGGADAWVMRLNADGSVVWQKTYGGTAYDTAAAVASASDGGYIAFGGTYSFGAGDYDAWVLKLSADGSVTWQKTYGGAGSDVAYSGRQTSDGGYVVGGQTSSSGAGGYDAWVLKLNSDGGAAWQKTYGGAAFDTASGIEQTPDGGYGIVGYTESFGQGLADAWVLKLDQGGGIAGCNNVGIAAFAGISYVTTADPADSSATADAGSGVSSPTAVVPAVSSETANKNCSYDPSGDKWQNTYGGTGWDMAKSVVQTADGGYIVAGHTLSYGVGNSDILLLKLNADGTVAWQKAYGGPGDDEAESIAQTADGGYVVAGFTDSFGAGGYDVWVLKLDAAGSPAWEYTYGGNGWEYGHSVVQTADGGYIVAGSATSFSAGNNQAWVIKLGPSGAVVWQKTYGGAGADYVYSIRQTADGGYIAAGSSTSFGVGFQSAWVLKLNSDGSDDWQQAYGGTGLDMAEADAVRQTSDGGYVVAGYIDSSVTGSRDAWVVKLNGDGTVAWEKTYGEADSDTAYSIEQTADGGYIVAGETYSFSVGLSDGWLWKLDAAGTIVWEKVYSGGTEFDSLSSVRQTSDGGFVAAGYTNSIGAGDRDFWVLRLDGEGGIAGCADIGTTAAIFLDSGAVVVPTAVSWASSAATVTSPPVAVADTVVTPAGVCSATYTQYLLDVYKEGSGSGLVASSPFGIDCGANCRGVFDSGTPVVLTPSADQGSFFAGWGGACNGGGQVTVDTDKYCVATFASVVDFSASPRGGLASLSVDFTDLSSNTPSGWFWNFGDGSTSALQNPSHSYLFPGAYTVDLAVTGPGGSGSISKLDYITVTCGSGVQTVRYGTPPSSWTSDSAIQSAYDNAADGDYVEPISVPFTGDVTFGLDKSVILRGGYDCTYSSSAAFTTVIGTVTFGGAGSGIGKVTVENIVVR